VSKKKNQKYVKLLQVILAVAAVYVILKYFLSLILPFAIAYVLCRLCYPAAEKLSQKTKIPLGITSGLVIMAAAVLCLAALIFAGNYLLGQIQLLAKNSEEIGQRFHQLYLSLCDFIAEWTGSRSDLIEAWFCDTADKAAAAVEEKLPQIIAGLGVPVIKGSAAFFIVFIVAFVGAVLLMKNKKQISRQVSKNIFASEITGMTARICQVSGCFLRAQAIIIVVIAIFLSAGLRLMGNKYGIIIGVITAILDALPVLGSGTILIPWAMIDLITGSYRNGFLLLAFYIVCTIIREFLEPRLMGDKLGINEFYMLMATFIGISLFGVWGIILGPLGMVMILEILSQVEELYDDPDQNGKV